MKPTPSAEQTPELQAPAPSTVGAGPRLSWSRPADGELGVRGDRDVELQFDQAMDMASVQAALTTTLPGELGLHWERNGSLLRIRPQQPMPYAEGTDRALEFSVRVSDAARSLAGAPLTAVALTFATSRRVRASLAPLVDLALTGIVVGSERGVSGSWQQSRAEGCTDGDWICVGDAFAGRAEWLQVKGFLSFDLRALPEEAEIESARLSISVGGLAGDPFGEAGLGTLHIERSWFSEIGEAAFVAESDATLGVVSGMLRGFQTSDIRWVIEEARERGLNQYRLTFPQTTNGDAVSDLVLFSPSAQRLQLTLLVR